MAGRVRAIFVVSMAAVFFVAVSGCNSTATISPPSQVAIEKGMMAEALLETLGEPERREPYKEAMDGVELWIYSAERVNTEMVSTELEEQLYIDPISGEERKVYHNIMNPETRTIETKTTFLIVEGRVEAWKVERSEQSTINH